MVLPYGRQDINPWRLCFTRRLSVCLYSHKNYWTDLRENFTRDVSVDKEEMIKFRKWCASRSRAWNFLKDSSTMQGGPFFSQSGSHLADLRENDLSNEFTVAITAYTKQHTWCHTIAGGRSNANAEMLYSSIAASWASGPAAMKPTLTPDWRIKHPVNCSTASVMIADHETIRHG